MFYSMLAFVSKSGDNILVFFSCFFLQINICVHGNAALHIACHRGYLDIVKHLLDNGADTNVTDNNGDTPLHYAVDG